MHHGSNLLPVLREEIREVEVKRVFVLSPLAPIVNAKPKTAGEDILFSFESNVAFAKRCVMNSIARGEAPFASHLLYPFVGLDDFDPRERALGMTCGKEQMGGSELLAVYVDRGVSKGMREELRYAKMRLDTITTAGSSMWIDNLIFEGNYRGAAQGILDLTRASDFRRLDGGPAPTWQWLHEQEIPHLRDMNGDACPECFGPAGGGR
jgi:hypothetical protein